MADPAHWRATYDDVLAAPADCIAELIHGVLHTQPRPAGAHAAVASARDKGEKLPIYAAHGVGHSWLIDPAVRTAEVWRLVNGSWTFVGAYADDAKLRVEPFDAVEIDLGALWADLVVGEAPRST